MHAPNPEHWQLAVDGSLDKQTPHLSSVCMYGGGDRQEQRGVLPEWLSLVDSIITVIPVVGWGWGEPGPLQPGEEVLFRSRSIHVADPPPLPTCPSCLQYRSTSFYTLALVR